MFLSPRTTAQKLATNFWSSTKLSFSRMWSMLEDQVMVSCRWLWTTSLVTKLFARISILQWLFKRATTLPNSSLWTVQKLKTGWSLVVNTAWISSTSTLARLSLTEISRGSRTKSQSFRRLSLKIRRSFNWQSLKKIRLFEKLQKMNPKLKVSRLSTPWYPPILKRWRIPKKTNWKSKRTSSNPCKKFKLKSTSLWIAWMGSIHPWTSFKLMPSSNSARTVESKISKSMKRSIVAVKTCSTERIHTKDVSKNTRLSSISSSKEWIFSR